MQCPEYVFALPEEIPTKFTKKGKIAPHKTQIEDTENEVFFNQQIEQQLKIPASFNYALNHTRTYDVLGQVIGKVQETTNIATSLLPNIFNFNGFIDAIVDPIVNVRRIVGTSILIIVDIAIILIVMPISHLCVPYLA